MKKKVVSYCFYVIVAASCSLLILLNTGSDFALTASRYPVMAKNGMVVSTQKVASQVGVEILKKGGNAVDAAVAVSYALAVVHPSAGNIGGGGYMVIRMPNGESVAIDYREMAPSAAYSDMYLDKDGNPVNSLSTYGILSCGVPGTVSGTMTALEKYGTMSSAEVLAPAIELAGKGFAVTPGLTRGLNRSSLRERFSNFDASSRIFMKPEGVLWEAGEILRQEDLAGTLKLIAENGMNGFYMGKVADDIVRTMKRYGGLITQEDLEDYTTYLRRPIEGTYRGYGIVSVAPSSSGGIALVQLLNILERFDLGWTGWSSAATVHLVTEAERRVYADRSEYLGDPDFVDIPVAKLISKDYANMRSADINRFTATRSADVSYGDISRTGKESEETTHYSVVDKDGTAVAVTTTLNGGYGSSVVVDGSGFLLNNEMDDFSIKPGHPNMYGLIGSKANSIRPGKRMLSSMTPTIVTKNGRNFMVIGSPGGSTIITTVLQVIMNVIDHGMDISEAVNAPRFHHQWYPDEIVHEKFAFSNDTIEKLVAMGHTLRSRGSIGDAHGIVIDPDTGLFFGGADTRMEGQAVGY